MKKKLKPNNTINEEIVNIDFDLFKIEEIVLIYSFYSLMQKNQKHPQNPQIILDAYNLYRNTINSISLEKKYNLEFEEKTGISIYHIIKKLKDINK